MVDRVSDADRLIAIELVNNLDSRLFDYVTENKDKLYLQSELYDKLKAAGLEPRNPRHWELITESLETRLKQNSLVLRPETEISAGQANFKSLYLHECKMVKRELIEIFKGYLESGNNFEIYPYKLGDPYYFYNLKFDKKNLTIRMKDEDLIPGYNIKNTFFGGIQIKAVSGYKKDKYDHKIWQYSDYSELVNNIYEYYFNSKINERIHKFSDFYFDLCKLPGRIRLTKEKWDSDVLEKNRKYHSEKEEKMFKAEETRKEVMQRMAR